MGNVAVTPEAQRLRPGDIVEYQGQSYQVARDNVTGKNQFFDTNTGEVYNPYSIYESQTQKLTSQSSSTMMRREQKGLWKMN